MRKHNCILLAIAASLALAACSDAAAPAASKNSIPETPSAAVAEALPAEQEPAPAQADPLFNDDAVEAVFASVDELVTIFDREDIVTYGDNWADIITAGVPAIRERGFQEIGFHYLLPSQDSSSDYRSSLKIGTIGDAVFMEFDLEQNVHWTMAALRADHPVLYLADKLDGVKALYSGQTTDAAGNATPYGEATDENGNTVILPRISVNGALVYGYQVFPSWILEDDASEEVSWQEVWWIYFEDTNNLYMMCSDFLPLEAWEDYREPFAMVNGAWDDVRDLPSVTNDGLNTGK